MIVHALLAPAEADMAAGKLRNARRPPTEVLRTGWGRRYSLQMARCSAPWPCAAPSHAAWRRSGGGHADARYEGYFPALVFAELAGGEQSGDLFGLIGAGLAVAGRGPVLQPGEQVCAGGLGGVGIAVIHGRQVSMDAVPGTRVLPDGQRDPS